VLWSEARGIFRWNTTFSSQQLLGEFGIGSSMEKFAETASRFVSAGADSVEAEDVGVLDRMVGDPERMRKERDGAPNWWLLTRSDESSGGGD